MIDSPAAMALARAYYEIIQLRPGGTPFLELGPGPVAEALRLSKLLEHIPSLAKDYVAEFKAIEKVDLFKEEELEIDRYINRFYDNPRRQPQDVAPTREAARKAVREEVAAKAKAVKK